MIPSNFFLPTKLPTSSNTPTPTPTASYQPLPLPLTSGNSHLPPARQTASVDLAALRLQIPRPSIHTHASQFPIPSPPNQTRPQTQKKPLPQNI
ncbi:hypothetical protein BDY21DRAFT_335252 [Lineolata rhizophorae]|uniref:Uncharacterized protein n=1 Tax=Lineolata rhizophorae TaxID=578093 RepID=A0A6A6P9D2_9PEZI|nr:hypothetical protein BDY21DRAFT_335252 [Lineolata rhizophorae]